MTNPFNALVLLKSYSKWAELFGLEQMSEMMLAVCVCVCVRICVCYTVCDANVNDKMTPHWQKKKKETEKATTHLLPWRCSLR